MPGYEVLLTLISEHPCSVSAASYVELLGFHGRSAQERKGLAAFFEAAHILPVGWPVLEQAVRLRQIKKMTLGDSLIAGTALVHGLTLVTRNTDDFHWVPGLKLFNPLAGF